jgi:hypothetical protein
MFSFQFSRPRGVSRRASSANRYRLAVILSLTGFLFLFPDSTFPQTKSSATNFAKLSKQADEARDADRLEEAAALYTRALSLQPKSNTTETSMPRPHWILRK